MRATTVIKLTALLALLAGISVAGVKNVAVVETEVDPQSGAAAKINKAEVRLITAGLRKEAVKNLPRDKYNIMTSETVQAQGGAVLEACADENCVITLGSTIGADYIVRGTISKLGTKLTVSVEMFETNDGNLVASSDIVSSEKAADLLEKATAACGEMFRTFVNPQGQGAAQIPTANVQQQGGGSGAGTKTVTERGNFKDDVVGIEMVFVKGGTFKMGCTSEQGKDCFDNEKPVHNVTVSDFYIGKYEVTVEMYMSGSVIGMVDIVQFLRLTLRDHLLALAVCFGAVVGAATRGTAVFLIVATAPLTAAATTWASALCCPPPSSPI